MQMGENACACSRPAEREKIHSFPAKKILAAASPLLCWNSHEKESLDFDQRLVLPSLAWRVKFRLRMSTTPSLCYFDYYQTGYYGCFWCTYTPDDEEEDETTSSRAHSLSLLSVCLSFRESACFASSSQFSSVSSWFFCWSIHRRERERDRMTSYSAPPRTVSIASSLLPCMPMDRFLRRTSESLSFSFLSFFQKTRGNLFSRIPRWEDITASVQKDVPLSLYVSNSLRSSRKVALLSEE